MAGVTVPIDCFFQGCYNPEFEKEIEKCKEKCFQYNKLCPNDREALGKILSSLLGKCDESTIIVPPFWCDYGYHISVGKNFYANHNTVVQDGGSVTFGDNVFIGPNCCFTTAEHAIDPEMRKAGIEIAKPITVGDNVWIGAGSVVTKPIPENVVAVGVPCRVLRKITEEDKYTYPSFNPEKE